MITNKQTRKQCERGRDCEQNFTNNERKKKPIVVNHVVFILSLPRKIKIFSRARKKKKFLNNFKKKKTFETTNKQTNEQRPNCELFFVYLPGMKQTNKQTNDLCPFYTFLINV